MSIRFPSGAIMVIAVLLSFYGGLAIAGESWHSGVWNSSVGHLAEHPKTVAIRIEVVDAATGLPLENAIVTVHGSFTEEVIGPGSNSYSTPPPQPRDFELEATTEGDGIAVFALGWNKEYPWRVGRPEPKKDWRGNTVYYDAHSTWMRAVDDIEKVKSLEIRCQDHYRETLDFNFDQLTEFGQDKTSESQSPDLFDAFEEAWRAEIRRSDVHFFKLQLADDFSNYGNPESMSPEFFQHIRNEDYGTIYQESVNWQGEGVGPYFVYLLVVELQRIESDK